MANEFAILTLIRAEIAANVAIVLILFLREGVRRKLGSALAYRLWGFVPLATISSLMPSLAEWLNGGVAHIGPKASVGWTAAASALEFWKPVAPEGIKIWLAGVVTLSFAFVLSEFRFRHRARLGLAGPAVIGIAAPRFVAPTDFHLRFDELERRLIRDHERIHIAQGHLQTNLWLSVFLASSWFNPLAYLAVVLCRFDQELACDALVLDGRPRDRQAYRNALLKAHLGHGNVADIPVGCSWSPRAYKSLAHRFEATQQPSLSVKAHVLGGVVLGIFALILVGAVWSSAPNIQIEQPNLKPPGARSIPP